MTIVQRMMPMSSSLRGMKNIPSVNLVRSCHPPTLKKQRAPSLKFVPRSSQQDNGGEEGEQDKPSTEVDQQEDNGDRTELNADGQQIASSAQANDNLQLPRAIISRIRDTVFTLDTFFVTSVENYGENGVLFKGNLRGVPATTYSKLSARLSEQLGEGYSLFLLEDQDQRPVAVVFPTESVQPQVSSLGETSLSILLGLSTIATTLNIMGADLFNAALLTINYDPELIKSALPGTFAVLSILLIHELGHVFGAKKTQLELSPPILIPAGLGLLGSFGSITRIKSKCIPSREALATVTAFGPLFGTCASLLFLGAGYILTAQGIGGIEVDSASFRESFLVGFLGQLFFGEKIFTSAALNCNPLLVAGWSGLIINAIQVVPVGELDGGRLFLALFGRRAASRMSAFSLFLLGIFGFNSSLSLFWLLFVVTLQRGPLLPCQEELTEMKDASFIKNVSLAALILPLLVLLPYPAADLFTNVDLGVDPGTLPPVF